MQNRGLSSTATPVGNVRKGYRLSARHKSGARSGTVPSRCTTRQRCKTETTRQNLVTPVTGIEKKMTGDEKNSPIDGAKLSSSVIHHRGGERIWRTNEAIAEYRKPSQFPRILS